MSARNLPVNAQLTTLERREVRPPAFKTKSASSLQWITRPSLPVRIAVIENHLPRQCGIATFTTDLFDAIAAGVSHHPPSALSLRTEWGSMAGMYSIAQRLHMSRGRLADTAGRSILGRWRTQCPRANMTMQRTCISTQPTPTQLPLPHTTEAITKRRKN